MLPYTHTRKLYCSYFSDITQDFPATCCKDADKHISVSKVADKKISKESFDITFLKNCYGVEQDGYTTNSTLFQVNEAGSLQKVKDLIAQSVYVIAGIATGIVLLQTVLLWAGCRLVNSRSFGKEEK